MAQLLPHTAVPPLADSLLELERWQKRWTVAELSQSLPLGFCLGFCPAIGQPSSQI
jgi:hypothetical protein